MLVITACTEVNSKFNTQEQKDLGMRSHLLYIGPMTHYPSTNPYMTQYIIRLPINELHLAIISNASLFYLCGEFKHNQPMQTNDACKLTWPLNVCVYV